MNTPVRTRTPLSHPVEPGTAVFLCPVLTTSLDMRGPSVLATRADALGSSADIGSRGDEEGTATDGQSGSALVDTPLAQHTATI